MLVTAACAATTRGDNMISDQREKASHAVQPYRLRGLALACAMTLLVLFLRSQVAASDCVSRVDRSTMPILNGNGAQDSASPAYRG